METVKDPQRLYIWKPGFNDLIKFFITCRSISMGAGSAVFWSWLVESRSSYEFAGLHMFPYKDRLPSSCSFTDSNAMRNTHSEDDITPKIKCCGILPRNVPKIFGNDRKKFGKFMETGRKLLDNILKQFLAQIPEVHIFGKFLAKVLSDSENFR